MRYAVGPQPERADWQSLLPTLLDTLLGGDGN